MDEKKGPTFLSFVKRDLLYIVCLILCLAAILTLSLRWESTMEDRDTYWKEEGCNTYINYIQKAAQDNDSWAIPLINISEYI